MSRLPGGLLLLVAASLPGSGRADEPLVVAHRGLLRHAPENTLANFRACLELRLGFEFDVQRTKDDHLVCIHDATVDRTTDGKGKVGGMTLAQLRRLDAGSWFHPRFAGEKVPTVEEVLQLVAAHRDRELLIAVDLKTADAGAEVARLAGKHKVLPRLLFIGKTITEPAVRKAIRAAAPKAPVAVVANDAGEFREAVADAGAAWAYVRFLPSKEQVAAARRAGKPVFIAGPTVSGDVPANWRRAADAGVRGILTDYPLELRTALRKGPASGHKARTSPTAPEANTASRESTSRAPSPR